MILQEEMMHKINYTSAERLLTALQHKEPDRIPFDLGATTVTGISIDAYKNLCAYLGMEEKDVKILDLKTRTAEISEDISNRLNCDIRGLMPKIYSDVQIQETDNYFTFSDEWQVEWRMPRKNGYYFNPVSHPLSGNVDKNDMDRFPWPDPTDEKKFEDLHAEAEAFDRMGKGIIMNHWVWGIFETASLLLRGMKEFYEDLVMRPKLACYLMDKILEEKIAFWDKALSTLGEHIHVVKQNDDMAGQDRLLISPYMYRKYIKPRHKKLFEFIKRKANVYIMFHSDGAIYELIPDFIEAGADILNPVQLSAKGMELQKLKKKFGEDICFWGGGIDTQKVLPRGSRKAIKEQVKENIETLAPGGGFVFSAVHNIQRDTPPENIMAMIEAFSEYANY